MITCRMVFCALTICGVVVATNTDTINYLKVLINKKNKSKGSSQSTLPITRPATTTTTAATTVTNPTATSPTTRMMSRDVHVHVVTTDVPRPSKNDNDNKAIVQKLCSALMYAATMQHNQQKTDGVTTATGRGQSSPVTFFVATGRRKSQRKLFRKKFPPSTPSNDVGNDFSGATMRPVTTYQDPILVQEFSHIDYVTGYPKEKENYDADVNDNSDQSTTMYKTDVIIGNPLEESTQNSQAYDDEHDNYYNNI